MTMIKSSVNTQTSSHTVNIKRSRNYFSTGQNVRDPQWLEYRGDYRNGLILRRCDCPKQPRSMVSLRVLPLLQNIHMPNQLQFRYLEQLNHQEGGVLQQAHNTSLSRETKVALLGHILRGKEYEKGEKN